MAQISRIRAYSHSDRAACLELFDANTPSAFLPEERPEYEAFLDHLPGPYLVVEGVAGEIVACGGYAVEGDGTTASLCWAMVHPSSQKEGIGRALLEARRDAAIAAGCTAVRLETTPAATGFFEKLGFRVVFIRPDGVGPGLDGVEMRWEVTPPAS